ncbi:MAG: 23S rRNA (guanosine(2251)-2'-O)-methyltransferase RlmB [Deltaproteobacteria bacterium]|nr:23S rRNA (guanosine(2251)-2'-O)-methyltransferase RlmB [Deltaproteobacteria bacterium]
MSNEQYIYGRHPVSELLRSRSREIQQLFLANGRNERHSDIIRNAQRFSITINKVPANALISMVGNVNHQGVVAVVATFKYCDIDDILQVAKKSDEAPLLLMLDQIQDPHNLGALIRSAAALGAHGVIISKDHSCEVNATVVKASAGATANIGIARVTNLNRNIEALKKAGLWVIGAAADAAARPLWQADFSLPSIIVIGSEGSGLRRLVAANCDVLVHIPMIERIESLNASVAGAIVLYEALRQRSK